MFRNWSVYRRERFVRRVIQCTYIETAIVFIVGIYWAIQDGIGVGFIFAALLLWNFYNIKIMKKKHKQFIREQF